MLHEYTGRDHILFQWDIKFHVSLISVQLILFRLVTTLSDIKITNNAFVFFPLILSITEVLIFLTLRFMSYVHSWTLLFKSNRKICFSMCMLSPFTFICVTDMFHLNSTIIFCNSVHCVIFSVSLENAYFLLFNSQIFWGLFRQFYIFILVPTFVFIPFKKKVLSSLLSY